MAMITFVDDWFEFNVHCFSSLLSLCWSKHDFHRHCRPSGGDQNEIVKRTRSVLLFCSIFDLERWYEWTPNNCWQNDSLSMLMIDSIACFECCQKSMSLSQTAEHDERDCLPCPLDGKPETNILHLSEFLAIISKIRLISVQQSIH